MNKITLELAQIKLVGITAIINNTQLFNDNYLTNIIAAMVEKYFSHNLVAKINNRINPGRTWCAYTHYERDHNGNFVYYIGEEVSSFESVPKDFSTLIIPAQKYTKFTNKPEAMPNACTNMWREI